MKQWHCFSKKWSETMRVNTKEAFNGNHTSSITSFKSEILQEGHQLATDTIKLALFTSSASLGAGTTAYSTSNEGVWNWLYSRWCYSHKHNLYQHQEQQLFDADDPTFTSASFTARGALIYNSSNSDKAIAVTRFWW